MAVPGSTATVVTKAGPNIGPRDSGLSLPPLAGPFLCGAREWASGSHCGYQEGQSTITKKEVTVPPALEINFVGTYPGSENKIQEKSTT